MKEHILKHYDLIFSQVKFPETNYENKLTLWQDAVQYLMKQDRFIYVQEGKNLVKSFQSPILIRVLCMLFGGPKPRFSHVLCGLKAITVPMLALACM